MSNFSHHPYKVINLECYEKINWKYLLFSFAAVAGLELGLSGL